MQLIKKLRNSFWLRSFLFSSMQRFSLVFFGAVSYFILARFFDNTQMGYWSLYTIIITLIEMVKQGLLRNASIKYLHTNEYANQKDEVQSASLAINILFTLLVVLLLLTCTNWLTSYLKAPPLRPMLYLSIFYMLILVPFSHCEMLLQAHFKFHHNFMASFIRQGIFFAFILLGRFFFPSYISFSHMVMVQIVAIGGGCIYYAFVIRQFLPKRLVFRKKIIVKLLDFGRFVCGTALFANVSRSFDHFITANLIDQTAVSYYNAVARVNNMIDTPSYAAAEILFPKFAQVGELEGPERIKYYFEKMVATLTAIIIPINIIILLLPKLVLLVVAGKKYMGAVPVLQISVFYVVLRPLINNFGHTIDSIGKPRLNFRVNFLMFAFNSVVTYSCLKHFGMLGAAYATFILHFTSFAVFYFILRKELNIELLNIALYIKQTYQQLFQRIAGVFASKKPVAEG